MPYIKQEKRERLDKEIAMLTGTMSGEPGVLSYVITKICLSIVNRWCSPPRYEDLAMILGILDATKLEIYNRMVVPYEQQKCKDHGDVF